MATKEPALRVHWRERFAKRVIPIAFVLSVTGIAGVGSLAYYLLDRAQESEAWVLHTAVAISRLEALHRTLLEAESAGRGFLVTGEKSYREALDRSAAKTDNDLHDFRSFTKDNPEQQELADTLSTHIEKRFAYLQGQVGLRHAGGFEALRTADISPGTNEMTIISATLNQMKEVENRLLAERIAVRKRHGAYMELALALLVISGIALMMMIFSVITRLWNQRQEAERRATHMAQHDALTGLPNRRLLADRVAVGLAYAQRYEEPLAILCLDLDGFKRVNDTHGHDAGDALLKLVAQRLEGILRKVDTVARTGGDEFIVALVRIQETASAGKVASKIIEKISEPYTLAQGEVSIGTSIGIAVYPIHGKTPEELFKRADEALYEAKRHGKHRYEIAAALPASDPVGA